MKLERLLHAQGLGTRKECRLWILAGEVWNLDSNECLDDPDLECPEDGLRLRVGSVELTCCRHVLAVINKPTGYECSMKPGFHPGIMTLLPPHWRARGVQPVGRLDVDTTGLLLLTDDGPLHHRLISPKYHVPKIYAVTVKHPITAEMLAALLAGVVLHDCHDELVRAQAVEQTSLFSLNLTLTEGKYHQVKRMIAAVGNRVEALHRHTVGRFVLPEDIQFSQCRLLDSSEKDLLLSLK
jgi:16S rRNA pseudouridine516 synthase